ncbi:MAG: CvpA family protein [Cytophagales bacterium]|nr:CvpA family protein [Cytophagales bacterium]
MNFNTLDYVCLGALVLSCLVGVWRGFVQETMSLVGWFAAFFAAYAFADRLEPYLTAAAAGDTTRYALAFGLLFIVTLIVWGVLTVILKKTLGAVGLAPLDRLLGGVFGALRGAVILLSLASFLSLTPIDSTEVWQSSLAVKTAKAVAHSLKPFLPASVAAFIH